MAEKVSSKTDLWKSQSEFNEKMNSDLNEIQEMMNSMMDMIRGLNKSTSSQNFQSSSSSIAVAHECAIPPLEAGIRVTGGAGQPSLLKMDTPRVEESIISLEELTRQIGADKVFEEMSHPITTENQGSEDDNFQLQLKTNEQHGKILNSWSEPENEGENAKDVSTRALQPCQIVISESDEMEKFPSAKIGGLGNVHHRFDEMLELILAVRNKGTVVHGEIVLLIVDVLKDLSYGSEVTDVYSLYILSKSEVNKGSMFLDIKNPELDVDFRIDEVLMFIFDPGGSSWFYNGCDHLESNVEQVNYCLATNMADISVKAIIHITRIMVASIFEAIVRYHGSDGEIFEHMAGTLLEWSLLYWFSRRNCPPSKNVCVCVADWRFDVACGFVFQLLFEVILVFFPFQITVLSSKSWRHGLYLFINAVLDGKGWEICLQKSDHCVSLKHLKWIHWVLDFDVVRLFWMMLCNGTRVEEMGVLFVSLCYDALKVIMDSSDLMQSFVALSSSLELNQLRDGYLRREMTPADLSCVPLEFFIPFSTNNGCLISSSYNSKEEPLEVLKLLMKQHDLSIPCILEYKCAITIILGIYPLLDGHDTAHSVGRENVEQAIVRFTTITQNVSPGGLDGIEDVLKAGCNTLGLKVSYLIWVVKTLFMFWLINQKCQCDHTFKDRYSVGTYCSVEFPKDHVKDISLLYFDEAWFLVRIGNYEIPRSFTDCPKETSFWFDSIMVKVPYKQTIKAFYLFLGKHHLVLRKEIVLVVAVNMENFVWNPEQSVISFCIIEGNDVFEGEEVIEDIHNVMKLCELLHTLTLASNNENKAQVQIALVKKIYAIYVEPDMNYLHRIMYRKDVEAGLITITLIMNDMCKGGIARHTHHLNSWIVHRLQLEILICWRLFEGNQRQSHLNLVLNIAGEPHILKLIITMKVHDYLAVSFCKGMHSIVAKSIFKKLVAWDIYIMEQRLRFYPLGVLCQCNEIATTSCAGELKAIRSRDFYAKWKPIDSWRHFLDGIVLAAILENFVWDPGLYMLL